MGGFEIEENNQYLIRFAVNMYKEFGRKVKWWVTLNEPSVSTLEEGRSDQWGCIWTLSTNASKCKLLLFLYLCPIFIHSTITAISAYVFRQQLP